MRETTSLLASYNSYSVHTAIIPIRYQHPKIPNRLQWSTQEPQFQSGGGSKTRKRVIDLDQNGLEPPRGTGKSKILWAKVKLSEANMTKNEMVILSVLCGTRAMTVSDCIALIGGGFGYSVHHEWTVLWRSDWQFQNNQLHRVLLDGLLWLEFLR